MRSHLNATQAKHQWNFTEDVIGIKFEESYNNNQIETIFELFKCHSNSESIEHKDNLNRK